MSIDEADAPTTTHTAAAPVMVTSAVQRRRLTRVEPWSVFRFSLYFYASMLLIAVIAGTLLWVVASMAGLIDNTEDVIAELFALEFFTFRPGVILRSTLLGGIVMVLVGTGANVVMAVLYNLIAEVSGGVEVTLTEDPSASRARI